MERGGRGGNTSNGVLKFNLGNICAKLSRDVGEGEGWPLLAPAPAAVAQLEASPGRGWDLLAGVSAAISLSSHKKPSAPLSFPNCCIYHQPFSACSLPHSARMCQNRDTPRSLPRWSCWADAGCSTGRSAEGPSFPACVAQITRAGPRCPGVRPFALSLDKQLEGEK